MNTAPAPRERLKVLDGLRAIAILLVMVMHSLRDFRADTSTPLLPLSFIDLSSLMYNGWIGVYLFFVLSGFLIGRQLLKINFADKSSRGPALRHYFKVRFFRIAPAYYVTLPAFLILYYIIPHHQGDGINPGEMGSWIQRLIVHVFFLQDYIPPPLAAYFWSLAVEAKFYLVAPLAVFCLLVFETTRARILAMLIVITYLIVMRGVTVMAMPDTFHGHDSYFFLVQARFHLALDALLAGLLCALIWQDEKMRAVIQKPFVANMLFAGGLLIIILFAAIKCIPYPPQHEMMQIFIPAILGLGFSLIMMGLLGQCRGYRLFEGRIFYGLALISYSLYLTHGFCLWFQNKALTLLVGGDIVPETSILYWLATLPVFFITSIVMAYGLYRCVEKPFIDWSHRKKTDYLT